MPPKNDTIFLNTQISFNTTLRLFYIKMPIECLNEMQYSLNHFMKGIVKNNRSSIHKAAGHLRRAHLDYLKVCLQQVYKRLIAKKAQCISIFIKEMLHARRLELEHIGEIQENYSIPAYRQVIQNFCEISGCNFNHPANFSQQHKIEEVFPHKILADDSTVNFPTNPVLQEQRDIVIEDVRSYHEWAALEMLLTSLRNSRHYTVILAMIESYYNRTMSAKLPYLKAVLKILIIRELHKKSPVDFDTAMKQPDILAEWKDCEQAAGDFARSKSSDVVAMQRMIASVEKPFASTVAHLGVKI